VQETAYRPITVTKTRDVPVVSYETAYREDEETVYEIEYETRTRDVPVEREVVAFFSNDSGDGIDSDSEGFYGPALPV
jgi:hypothetical protein